MSPVALAGGGIHAVQFLATVCYEHKAAGNRRRAHAVAFERITPQFDAFGGVHAFQPRFVLAPPDVAAVGDVEPAIVEDRHAFDVAGADFAVADVTVDVLFRRGRVGIVLPDFLEGIACLERVHDAVAATEENQRTTTHFAKCRRGPSAVERVWRNVFVLPGDEFAGDFVEHDEARRLGRGNGLVSIVETVGGVDVEELSVQQNRAVRGIVLADAAFLDDIEPPEGVGLGERRLLRVKIEAEDFTAVGDDIDAVALNGGGRTHAVVWPVPEPACRDLVADQLPAESPIALVETHQHAAVADFLRVARRVVVGADEDASAGDDGRAVGFGAERDGPFHVGAGGGVEVVGQGGFGGDHVAGESFAPLRLVGGDRQQAKQQYHPLVNTHSRCYTSGL